MSLKLIKSAADGFLKDFMTTTESTDPEARGRALEECDSIAQVG